MALYNVISRLEFMQKQDKGKNLIVLWGITPPSERKPGYQKDLQSNGHTDLGSNPVFLTLAIRE